jgi:DNA-binding beta-propeller fold protein YncE
VNTRPLILGTSFAAIAVFAMSANFATRMQAQMSAPPLKLLQTIPLPNVKGRIDHIDVDIKGNRLFVAGLENGTLEVVDLKAGKWTRSIPGFKAPQGIAYIPSVNKVFVASNDDGMVRVFRGDTLELLDTIHLDLAPTASRTIPMPE